MAAPVSVPLDVLTSRAQALPSSASDLARKTRIAASAQAFEAQFLSSMLQPMFSALSTEAPFGGGSAEGMFRSFLTDAIAKQTARSGGIGVSDLIQREMLKLQGLDQPEPQPEGPPHDS